MKVELIKIVNVVDKFNILTEKRYRNWGTALRLAHYKKELEEQRSFYMEQEKKIILDHVMRDKSGNLQFTENGQPKFKSVDEANKFQEELISLQKTEVDIFDPICISTNDFKSDEDSLSPDDIIALGEFVEFSEHEEGGKL